MFANALLLAFPGVNHFACLNFYSCYTKISIGVGLWNSIASILKCKIYLRLFLKMHFSNVIVVYQKAPFGAVFLEYVKHDL